MDHLDRRSFLRLSVLTPAALAAGSVPALAAGTANGTAPVPNRGRHQFGFAPDGSAFLLDGKPFQIRSGEMHPSRIPPQYWRQRIRMAKAMGLNTVSLYVMWNFIEQAEGVFDFETGRRNFAAFVRTCQEEGMWVLLRPGPYVCGEWDLGGIPPYLLADPSIQLRVGSATDPRYMAAVSRYYAQLIPRVRPLLVANGGPVLMVQIENEYGSFGADQSYLEELRQLWIDGGVPGPFYTEDGLSQVEQNHTNVPGGAIALSGGDANQIAQARQAFPQVPAMAGEVYPGWLTHWGDPVIEGGGPEYDISSTLQGLMAGGLSFNLYMFHGGTSFGLWAGSNAANDGSEFQADITSYDYSAPVTEQGVATTRYRQYRQIIARSLKTTLPPIPTAIPTIARPASPDMTPKAYASLWNNLPAPAVTSDAPQSMESLGQQHGFVLYRRPLLPTGTSGTLTIDGVRDYATVQLGGTYQGGFSRQTLPAPYASPLNLVGDDGALAIAASRAGQPTLDVLVEAMGHVNYGHAIVDPKGILGSVSLAAGSGSPETLTGWETFLLGMDWAYVAGLRRGVGDRNRPGQFFALELTLGTRADTYVDMSGWTKGIVWVNGNCLGRYWNLGPQQHLYCPAPFLRRGFNEIVLFDAHQTQPAPLGLARTLR